MKLKRQIVLGGVLLSLSTAACVYFMEKAGKMIEERKKKEK